MNPNKSLRISEEANPKGPSHIAVHALQNNTAPTNTVMEDSTFSAFKLFPKLPLELRLMVWKLSLPEGRVIKFSTIRALSANKHLIVDQKLPTPLLHVNQESRLEALQAYELFAGRWRGDPIYVNFKKDTLKFRLVDQFALLCGIRHGARGLAEEHTDTDVLSFLRKVHHIEFGEDSLGYGYLRDMASLESIKIVPPARLSRLIFWQLENGSSGCERWSKKNQSLIESQLVESWTGIKMGKWTGPKDKLPRVNYIWKDYIPRRRNFNTLWR